MFFSKYFCSLSAGKKLAALGVFVALSIVTNCFSVDVGAANKIAFTYVICFLAGCVLGGVPAFFIAVIGDAVGYLLNPQGMFFLFGVTLGVYSLLMGIVMNLPFGRGRGAPYIKAAAALLIGYALITVLLNSAVNYWYACLFFWNGVPQKTFLVYLGARLAFQSIVYAVNAALCFAVLPAVLQLRRRAAKKHAAASQTDPTGSGA